MGIFLRQSHNVKPPRWGSFADVQYAIRVNSEKIYDCDPDDDVLVMPLFWGLPALDYSGFNNHGTNYGATYKDGSLDFDGVDDYVDAGDIVVLGTNADKTVSIWMNLRSDDGTYDRALTKNKQNDALGFMIVYAHNLNKMMAVFNDGAEMIGGFGSVITDTWYHLTAVYDESAGTISCFTNGASGEDGQGDAWGFDANDNLNIGGRPLANLFWNGLIDEVRISNVARTADQIALFHDNKYGLYQKVSRPIWSIPAVGVTIPIFMQNMRGSFNSPGTRGGFIN